MAEGERYAYVEVLSARAYIFALGRIIVDKRRDGKILKNQNV